MEEKKTIPPSSRRRYPLYLRALQQLKQRGEERVMSYQIGNMCGVPANTVRRDLMYVNHKGRTAAGYGVEELFNALSEELGTENNDASLVLIGVGNIGHGLLKYNYLNSRIGHIVCAYDTDPKKVGTIISGVPVYSFSSIKNTFPNECKIAILAIPKENIDEVVNILVSLKVKAIINFSDGIPRRKNNVVIHQVDLAKIVSEIIYDFKTKQMEK